MDDVAAKGYLRLCPALGYTIELLRNNVIQKEVGFFKYFFKKV